MDLFSVLWVPALLIVSYVGWFYVGWKARSVLERHRATQEFGDTD